MLCMKKNRAEKVNRESGEMKRLPVVFSALVKEGFSEQVTFEQT